MKISGSAHGEACQKETSLPKLIKTFNEHLVQNGSDRLVTISQGTARNHFWEAGMLMQSSILDIVQ